MILDETHESKFSLLPLPSCSEKEVSWSQKKEDTCLQKVQSFLTQSSYIQNLEFASFSKLNIKLKQLSWLKSLISESHLELLVVQENISTRIFTTVSLVAVCRSTSPVLIWTENAFPLLCSTVEQFYLDKTIRQLHVTG